MTVPEEVILLLAGQNVCIRNRTMQLILLLGVKLTEVYGGKTHISLSILCLVLPSALFFGSLYFDWDTNWAVATKDNILEI